MKHYYDSTRKTSSVYVGFVWLLCMGCDSFKKVDPFFPPIWATSAQTSFDKQYDAGHLGSNSTQLKGKTQQTTHLNSYFTINDWSRCAAVETWWILPGRSRTELVILFPIHKTNSSHLKMDGWEMILSVWERPTPWKINGCRFYSHHPWKGRKMDLNQTFMRTCSSR